MTRHLRRLEPLDPEAVHTEGCSMCAAMEPVLGTVARASDVAVGLCNPRDDPSLVERFDVQSVPLLVRFEGGEAVGRLADGFVGTERVLAFLDGDRGERGDHGDTET
jgi:thioredoxin 1